MTRKHFKELARILKDTDTATLNPVLIREIANFCYNENPRFDRGRFYDACGIDL